MASGLHGKTAQFWLSYMNHVELIMRFLMATKKNDLELYQACITSMCPLYFAFGGINYARYLSFQSVFLQSIDQTHPGAKGLLEKGALSVARSLPPGCCNPVDLTIEQTFMKHAKSRGGGPGVGIIGITRNPKAYQRWVLTRHHRALYLNATYRMADLTSDEHTDYQHKYARPSQIIRSEKAVQDVLKAIDGFVNPFEIERKENLFCLASGAAVNSLIESEVLGAEEAGKTAYENFMQCRIIDKIIDFHEPLTKLKLETFKSKAKCVKLSGSKRKQLELKASRNIAFQLLALAEKHQLDLAKCFQYPLGPVSWPLGTPDGFLAKTDKSKGMHYIKKNTPRAARPCSNDSTVVIDGNALFYSIGKALKTFKDLASFIFDMIPNVPQVHFSTDM